MRPFAEKGHYDAPPKRAVAVCGFRQMLGKGTSKCCMPGKCTRPMRTAPPELRPKTPNFNGVVLCLSLRLFNNKAKAQQCQQRLVIRCNTSAVQASACTPRPHCSERHTSAPWNGAVATRSQRSPAPALHIMDMVMLLCRQRTLPSFARSAARILSIGRSAAAVLWGAICNQSIPVAASAMSQPQRW
jgi:hypothetical protein